MKALFQNRFRSLLLFPIFFAFFCYSAEFQPSAGYANLRRREVSEVRVVFSVPKGQVTRIGQLIIRDYPGDIEDRSFVEFVKGQARDHGANIAWIAERTVRKGAANLVQLHGRRGYEGVQTTVLEGDVPVIKVFLFVTDE